MIRFIVKYGVLVLLNLIIALLIGGCDESEDLCRLEVPAGRIQGQVLTGECPIEAEVVVIDINGVEGLNAELRTVPDFYGNFSLDLPAGQYRVLLRVGSRRHEYDWCGDQIGYGELEPEIITIDSGSIITGVDFPLSSLRFELSMSNVLDGEYAKLVLHRKDAVVSDPWNTYLNQKSEVIENGNLAFYLVGVLPGEYQVEVVLGLKDYLCSCPYDGEHVWMPGVRQQDSSPWYNFAADSLVTITSTLPQQSGRIEGSVTGAWQEMGLEAPEISLFTPDSTVVMGRRRIMDSEGTFGVDLQLPGPTKVRVTHSGVEKWVGGDSFEEATEYDVQGGQVVTGVDLVRGGMNLQVVSADYPVMGNVDIRLYNPDDLSLISVAEFYNQSQATEVGVANLDPGNYLLYLTPRKYDRGSSAWRSQWFDRAADSGTAASVTISAAGEVVDLEIHLEKGGTLQGSYEPELADGNWRHVLAVRIDDSSEWYRDYFFPEHQDQFLIRGLPDGQYKLGEFSVGSGWDYGAPAPGETNWYGGDSWEDATVLTIENAADLTDIIFSNDR